MVRRNILKAILAIGYLKPKTSQHIILAELEIKRQRQPRSMSLLSKIKSSPQVNRLRGVYHQLKGHLSLPLGLITPVQSSGAILQLIESLRPVSTEHPLIRIGPNGDGGYLIPDDLSGIQACYSPGVSNTIGFDLNCASLGMNVFLADASVDGLPQDHANLFFTRKFLASWEDETHITIDQWVKATCADTRGDLILQMDIEGAEYQVLTSISDALLSRFRILVIEFHLLDHLWNPGFFSLVQPVFTRVLRSHHCVHLHPNNCCGCIARGELEIPRVMEFTFLRKDRASLPEQVQSSYPLANDHDNTSNPTLALPKCWQHP